VANPAGWWARFAPQLWWIPVGAAVAGVTASHRRLQHVGLLLMVALEVNIALSSLPHLVIQLALNHDVHRQMDAIADADRFQDVQVKFNYFEPLRIRLQEAGIQYREVSSLTCREPLVLLGSRTQVCAGDPPLKVP